jgi:P27 family predicted phage terminase small subunit
MAELNPPAGLDPASRAIWTATIAQVLEAGTMARLDLNSLAAYVSAVRTHQRATELLTASDVLIERDGKPVPNPALTVQVQAAAVIAAFARQFRLTAHHPAGPGQEHHHTPDQPEALAGVNAAPLPMGARGEHPGTWCEDHHRWECRAPKSRDRGPCHGIATVTGRCASHIGGPSARANKLATELVRRDPTYGVPEKITAEDALVGELWRTAGHVKWLGERVAELEASALTWGTTQTVTRYWGEFPGGEQVARAGPHILLDLYDRERKHLVHVAAEIIRAGLAARLLDTAQRQGAAFGRVTDLILHDLGLSPAQWALVPEVVPRRFRELAS